MSIILFLLCLAIIKAECPTGEVSEELCASPCIWDKTKDATCEGDNNCRSALRNTGVCPLDQGCKFTQAIGICTEQESSDSPTDIGQTNIYRTFVVFAAMILFILIIFIFIL